MVTADPEEQFASVLATRYCRSSPLLRILSERNKAEIWRQLWIWLAEAELELGITQVTQKAIDEMKAAKAQIDWPALRAEERRVKHDVMAHNHVFGKLCPSAAGIIHLGATSCFVQDNADLIVFRDAVDHLLRRQATCLSRLADFAKLHAADVTIGRTHYQSASLTTVGKRAAMWAQELLMAFQQLESFRKTMRFRGIKGATGTQDSFLTLFEGDEDKVEQLDDLVTAKAGFARRFAITGQTYTRQQDVQLISALTVFGAAAKKICHDIRVLQGFGELQEPFESSQIGSSAMPYKRNPMKCERVCSIAKTLITKNQTALDTFADQGLERTLDDSAARRMLLPDALLETEAILLTLQNIFEGLTFPAEAVVMAVRRELPFLGLEKALMQLTQTGVDRQKAHEFIRETSLRFRVKQEAEGVPVKMEDVLADDFFDPVRESILALVSDPLLFTGRARSQALTFLEKELYPVIHPYLDTATSDQKVQLDV